MKGRRVVRMAVLAVWPAIAACEIISGLSSLDEEPAEAGAAPSADGSSGSSGSPPPLEAGSDAAEAGAIVPPGPFALTVAITGTNRGTIKTIPAGIDCFSALPDASPAPRCSASFAGGTVINFDVTIPEAFSWGAGDCAYALDGTCTLVMDSPKDVVGAFSSY